ncbi:3-oxoacyl-[acyl-carrier protein] reductase [Actinocorallia herbida]|uniref:3-oxoacyl-[acyl-carrier protein] reductase n=1 Tax=Actinocorallia herbida TaxID=58109 RepID=A0A3N1CXQ0_9ACTN|nr:SDR family NAD(P)-dependent oxidoreductase [Actinocorallia herbida]ROO86067.1 3-oxoacyl-[acyl-carrier protein] reductase [Actinocorallia herbida]
MSLAGSKIIVTGAAQGLGRAHCAELCAQGALVGAIDLDADLLAKTGADLGIATAVADVSARDQVEQAVARLAAELDGIDAVVSNAGTIHTVQGLADTDDADWERTFAVHVGGARNLIRAALPWLRRSAAPRIVVISSMWAQRGPGFGHAYCAAKGALVSFARNLAVELGPEGINVNSVAPGSVPTRMAADYGPAEIAEDCRSIPLGRWGDAAEISRVVAFLASPAASYVTGQDLAVNGGQVIA